MATEKNTEMPKIIVEQINNKLFSSYKVLFIPTFPNVFSLKRLYGFITYIII
ncbi:hypothetical protein [Escherichia coli]|uniref:hypothetical protein n=1 Tax=Escherichia coli TaxID=562 RepID=UPI00388DE2E6